MRRLPVVATLLVGLAVAAMIMLGIWQLRRLDEKEAFLAQVAGNPARAVVPFPSAPDDTLLFRRSQLDCRPPTKLLQTGAGAAGFRLIATCANGPRVQLGTTHDPAARIDWSGGPVTGWISHAPDARPLIVALFSHAPPQMMLVSDHPLAGLAANARPDPSIIPNNHLAYAGQWFFFAAVACVIYALALRRRWQR